MKKYKIKFKHLIVFSILFSNSLSAFAQDYSVVEDLDILEKQKTVLMQNNPDVFTGVDIKKIQKIDSKHSKVFYSKGNQKYEAIVNSGRKEMMLIAKCRVVEEDEMRKIILDAFKSSKYKNWDIEKTFEVKTPYSGLFYRIDISKKTYVKKKKKIKSLFYTHLGQYKEPPY